MTEQLNVPNTDTTILGDYSISINSFLSKTGKPVHVAYISQGHQLMAQTEEYDELAKAQAIAAVYLHRIRNGIPYDLDTFSHNMFAVMELIKAKGFQTGEDDKINWKRLMLITTEIAEAAQALKHGEGNTQIAEELMDAIIRILHVFGEIGVDPDKIFKEKMDKNWKRPYHYNDVGS